MGDGNTCDQMFTHEEWTLDKKLKCARAEKERENAEAVQNEADRLMDETAKRTMKTNRDVNKKIEQRLNDVKYWKKEIDKKLDDVTNETNSLDKYFHRLNRALEATDEPLHVAEQCIKNRMSREGIDLVCDDAHKELKKEVDTIKGVQALLKRSIEQAKEQIRLNRKSIYDLKNASQDKLNAQNIDEFCESLRTDQDLTGVGCKNEPNPSSFSFEDWQQFSISRINDGDKQIQNSKQLRSILDAIMQQAAADQQKQFDATNRALQRRIDETRKAKGELEEHLARVFKEMSRMEDTIVDLEKAIEGKTDSQILAEIREHCREGRPNIENTKDKPMARLAEQKIELQQDVQSLIDQLKNAHASLKGLRRKQLELEEVRIKTDTLFIDEVACMGLRSSVKFTAY